jgi:hypothetical protein
MKYRGIEYAVIQDIDWGTWNWTVDLIDGTAESGPAQNARRCVGRCHTDHRSMDSTKEYESSSGGPSCTTCAPGTIALSLVTRLDAASKLKIHPLSGRSPRRGPLRQNPLCETLFRAKDP